MSNDPAFLFYPGDYLRDTQCLSEAVQVAYDRIICEHMRNICIRQDQLNFFTKRLSAEQKKELLMVLKKTDDGYCIPWVAESISKRRSYSESRRKNRSSKPNNISKSYDEHMEIEIENVIEIINDNEIGKTIEFIKITSQWDLSPEKVKDYWKAFMIQNKGPGKRSDKIKHFRAWLKIQKPTNGTYKPASSGKSSGANELAEQLASKLAARGSSNI